MRNSYEEIAQEYGVSVEGVKVLALALRAGRGQMAQFNHPDLGGRGQWMPGMVQIGDMFNNALKAKIDAVCTALLAGYDETTTEQMLPVVMPGFTWEAPADVKPWWNPRYGMPDAGGAQNELEYVYFAHHNRLIVRRGEVKTVYDTTGYTINGFSQKQRNGVSSVVFSSQGRVIDANILKIVLE